MNEQNEIAEARKYALDLETYREIRKQNLLKKCLPPEGGTCGSADRILASLLDKYDINDLMSKKTPEYKKGKELLLSCLFVYMIKEGVSNKMAVCVPSEDRGIDIYVREIDYPKKLIILRPLQICEFSEKYSPDKEVDFTNKIYNFIKKTKFKYAKGKDALFLWLEPDENRKLDLKKLRDMFKAESKTIPFVQIIIFGKNGDLFNICSAYSKNEDDHYAFSYNYKENKIVRR